LILGLIKPSAGRVLIHGVDTRRAKVSELARHIGSIFQDPNSRIFAGSVEDKIRFGLKNLPEFDALNWGRWALFVVLLSRRAHQEVFAAHPPTTTMVEVKSLIDPAMLIEIEADAVILDV
jgi:energy-coupling factor transporter ATP-binding protein EcfA2